MCRAHHVRRRSLIILMRPTQARERVSLARFLGSRAISMEAFVDEALAVRADVVRQRPALAGAAHHPRMHYLGMPCWWDACAGGIGWCAGASETETS